MNVTLITLIIWAALLVLLFTNMPIVFSMLVVSIFGYIIFVGPKSLFAITPIVADTLTKDVLIAIPLFILMATVLLESGIGESMYDAMYKWMAGLPGGLAIGTILICTLIAATTGLVATGTVITGMLAYPEMRRRGYDKIIAIGVIIAGGILGPLIPPSITMILVANFGGISTGQLFMAGVLPGIVAASLFIIYVGLRCFHEPRLGPPIPVDQRASWSQKIGALRALTLPVFLVVLVLGGIWVGAFTPSEAGGIGATGALIVAGINRKLTLSHLKKAVTSAFKTNAMVLWLAIAGSLFTSLSGMTGVTHFISNILSAIPFSTTGVVITMIVIVLIMGMFLESLALTMIIVPIMLPAAIKVGADPLLFGFLLSFAIIIGALTPPFGYSLFYFKGLGHVDVSMSDIYKAGWIFSVLITMVLFICIFYPPLPMWLPSLM